VQWLRLSCEIGQQGKIVKHFSQYVTQV
jgi:hypothetical protein